MFDPGIPFASTPAELALQVYLLGPVAFDAALAWQRRLVYDVSGERSNACLILCEHPPVITIGRQGSRSHLRYEPEELLHRDWRIRWVNRGGGCQLHLPGQFAIYPVLPLDRLQLGVQAYLDGLHDVVSRTLADFTVASERHAARPGLWSGGRLIASFGIAVRDWVSYYGGVLNVDCDLEPFRRISCGYGGEPPMTSLARQRHGPLRSSMVRERLVEYFAARFGFSRVSLFFGHPALSSKAPSDAVTAGY